MEPDSLYLIINKATEPEFLFRDWENVDYFKQKVTHHISSVATIISVSCSSERVEMIIKTHSMDEIRKAQKQLSAKRKSLNHFITQRIKNLFNCYAQAYNKRFIRHGALFQKSFKAYLLTQEEMHEIIEFNTYLLKDAA